MSYETTAASTAAGRRPGWHYIAAIIFVLWVIAFMVFELRADLGKLRMMDLLLTSNYIFWYTIVFGLILAAIRKPAAAWFDSSPIPNGLVFVALGSLACLVEVWIRIPIQSMEFLAGWIILSGWVVGAYLVARLLRLSMMELWIVTGLSGCFQELMIFFPLELIKEPGRSILVIPWGIWAYAMILLIPVTLIPGPHAARATSGRWWRYLLTFAVPVISSQVIARIALALLAAWGYQIENTPNTPEAPPAASAPASADSL